MESVNVKACFGSIAAGHEWQVSGNLNSLTTIRSGLGTAGREGPVSGKLRTVVLAKANGQNAANGLNRSAVLGAPN